jgi:spore coat polysaccharide biosynthesis protein SpsF
LSRGGPLAIIQARVGSTRLPGKALADIAGAPMTEHVVRRTHRAVPDPVLAIPDTSPNDELEERAADWPCDVVRGPEEDVLSRFMEVLEQYKEADPILRVTGDNPLISSRLMEKLPEKIGLADWARWQWVPYGVGNSIFTRESIEEAHELATSERDREHVTLYIRRRDEFEPNIFRPPTDYRAPGLRLTVDTHEDLKLIRRLHEAISGGPFSIDSREAIDLLAQRPDLIDINQSVHQEVYEKQVRVLYTMNRGNEWGTGHWTRYRRIRSNLYSHSGRNIQTYGLLGDLTDRNDESEEALHRLREPLDESTIKLWARRAGARLVVQDVKYSDESLVTSLKEEGARVIGIEDRGPGREHMDAVVDPNLYDDTLTDDNVPPNNRYYGPDYALIDPAFRNERRTETPDSLDSLGIFFGGTDPNELGANFLKVAVDTIEPVDIHHFGPNKIYSNNCKVFQNSDFSEDRFFERGLVDAPASAFSKMDLMVIAGGIVKFEVACLNVPAMVIPQNKEQYENTHRFIEKNGLNWPLFSPESTPNDWASFLEEKPPSEHLVSWSESIKDVVDGQGMARFREIINSVLDQSEASGGNHG